MASADTKKRLALQELHSGWVVKEGKVRRSWRRRFFVLQGGTLLGRIDYFKEERKVWRGAIALHRADPVETIEDPRSRRGQQQQLFCVAVRTPARTWRFGVLSEAERTQWIAAINSVIVQLRDPDAVRMSPPLSQQQQAQLSQQPTQQSQQSQQQPLEVAVYAAATDPEGDRARLAELCKRIEGWAERERALQRVSREIVPRGRLVVESSAQDGSDVLAELSLDEGDGDSGDDAAAAAQQQPLTGVDSALQTQVVELSRVYEEWGTALAAYAMELSQHPTQVLGPKGLPAAAFDDIGTPRDPRFVLLAFSEAWEKTVGGVDRQRRPRREAVMHCRKLLSAWGACLSSLAGAGAADTFASATHPRLGGSSPVQLLSRTPELVRRIALWAVPSISPLERSVLAQQATEKAFLQRHLGRLLYRGPVRFGFLSVCQPASDGDNFAHIAGRCPPPGYPGEIPGGQRLFCELLHDSLCFTSPASVEVAVPLLWIRKLEIETTAGCFMKFTRYLSQPSPEAQLESRVLYADNAHETFAWLSDITRAFVTRRKHESSSSSAAPAPAPR